MRKVEKYTKVTSKNLRYLYNSPRGNLYMRYPKKKGSYGVVDGFGYDELHDALTSGRIDLIWIEGPATDEAVEVE